MSNEENTVDNQRKKAVDNLIEALAEAGFNPGKPNGIFGEEVHCALEAFWYDRNNKSDHQINAVLRAVKALLETEEDEHVLAEAVSINGIIGENETAGIRRLLELYELQSAG